MRFLVLKCVFAHLIDLSRQGLLRGHRNWGDRVAFACCNASAHPHRAGRAAVTEGQTLSPVELLCTRKGGTVEKERLQDG